MKNLVLTVTVAAMLIVGCASQKISRTDWRRANLLSLDDAIAEINWENWTITQCTNVEKDETDQTIRKTFYDCVYEVSDKMPATVNIFQREALKKEMTSCALNKIAKYYIDNWNLVNVSKDQHQKCLEYYKRMEKFIKTE